MPRLNYGTLLENIVVVEANRLAFECLSEPEALGFATSFAMPPLTQCWCKLSEEASNSSFNGGRLQMLARQASPSGSLQAMWTLCVANGPGLPIRRFHQPDERILFEFGGPNGALLASLLAIQLGREIHVWANDNGERYPKEPASSAAADLDELAVAGVLLSTKPIGSATRVGGWFPNSIERLATWLTAGAGRATRIRVGFLDPDNYAEGQTQVSSFDHRNWLRTLAEGSPRVLSAMFSGCQNRGPGNSKRDQRLASFHGDESALYPFSVVFEYGNFQTGVKIRWPQESLAEIGARLIRRVRTEWQNWDPSLGSLAVHVNGQSGS